MDKRKQFIEFVKNGGERFCSPQIGAGAGFDTKLAGKEWISETSLEDTMAAVEKFDIVPLINIGLCDLGSYNAKLAWEEKVIEKNSNKIIKEFYLTTPVGTLYKKSVEEKFSSPFLTKNAVMDEADLDPFEYYLDTSINSDVSYVTEYVNQLSEKIGNRGALSIQWAMQPYEMLCFPNTIDTVLLANDCTERFIKLMDKIVKLDEKLIDAVAAGGADFVFLGAPASEIISPYYYEKFIVPYSQIVSSMVHNKGLLIYSHICSPIEPMLTKGYYNQMGIDLFETISPRPVGNILSLEDAMSKINPEICTRGNLALDVLLECNMKTVKEKTFEILEATKGRKHMVAASDYLFYQIPEENLHAMCEAVEEYRE